MFGAGHVRESFTKLMTCAVKTDAESGFLLEGLKA